uniref:Solute carrier family 26 member 10 n=1 Tax=Oryctolagus cuniculus TaxID=9986 RepID=A0A5F9CXP7_RABIT
MPDLDPPVSPRAADLERRPAWVLWQVLCVCRPAPGTFAVLSLMTGSVVERLVPEPLAGNLSAVEREQLDDQRVGAASALAFGSGALMLAMFALQLGVLATFLSEPVVKALTSGAAMHVLVSQLPSLLGLSLPRQIGCFSLFKVGMGDQRRFPAVAGKRETRKGGGWHVLGARGRRWHPRRQREQRASPGSGGSLPGRSPWLGSSLTALPADAGRRADGAAPEQSGRTDHLSAQPGAAGAGEGIEREVPRQAAHPDPRGSRHGRLPGHLDPAESPPHAVPPLTASSPDLVGHLLPGHSGPLRSRRAQHSPTTLFCNSWPVFLPRKTAFSLAATKSTSQVSTASFPTQDGSVDPVLLATVLCFTSSLDTRYNVQIVGLLPQGFPQPHFPNLAELPRTLANSLPIALVTFAVSASLASIYADKYCYTIDSNQELLAHGVSNLISSLFSCFPNSATLATTSLHVDAGGNTQLAGLFSCTVVLSVLLWLGPFFYYLPKAVLACINISSMRQMFFQMHELPQLWRISRVDFAVWMVTWVAVVTLSVELGLAVGVVFSMMTVVCRTQRVQCLALGHAAGTELYRPLRDSHELLQVPGLCILSCPMPLYFGTRGQFRRSLECHLGLAEKGQDTPKPEGPPDTVAEPVRVVILDFSGVTFADAAGAREVAQLARRCQDAGIHLLLAQCNASVLGTLTRAGLLDTVTPEQLFVSVQDAAAHALERLELTGPKICTVWL